MVATAGILAAVVIVGVCVWAALNLGEIMADVIRAMIPTA
jgi:hypothetical protein